MKLLWVGDPHAQPSNLDEMAKLSDLIVSVAESEQVDGIVLAGDLFHTHAVVRVEVMSFWLKAIRKMSLVTPKVIVLVGNHDMPADKTNEASISSLEPIKMLYGSVVVVDSPLLIGDHGFMPYRHSHELFLSDSESLLAQGAKYLFCHQTIEGSRYDNGMYAPDGVPAEKLTGFSRVVSGHIHSFQQFANITYPGTPRWDSMVDAGQDKALWIINNGELQSKISTAGVCQPVRRILLTPSDPVPSSFEPRTTVELSGPSAWISSVSKDLRNKVRIVPRPTDSATKSQNTRTTIDLSSFLSSFEVSPGVSKEELKTYVEDMWK